MTESKFGQVLIALLIAFALAIVLLFGVRHYDIEEYKVKADVKQEQNDSDYMTEQREDCFDKLRDMMDEEGYDVTELTSLINC